MISFFGIKEMGNLGFKARSEKINFSILSGCILDTILGGYKSRSK
jgi:hypothetical protein